jgi:hypothetical protein
LRSRSNSSDSVLLASPTRPVGAPLRFADDQLAAKQLDAFVFVENADVDHAVVLGPAPSSRADRILHDGVEATARVQASQMS